MTYDERPWIKSYDAGVDPDFLAPHKTYTELIEENFSEFADHPAMHFMGTTITFRRLDEYSKKFASFLVEIGCEPGDVVGINLPNIPQYLIAHAGTLRAGCAATGVSPLLLQKEVAYQLNDSGARVLVTLDANFESCVLKFHDRAPKLTHIVATNIADFAPTMKNLIGKTLKEIPKGKVSPLPGKTVLTFPELLAKYRAGRPKIKITPEDTCLIQYTGGTTGVPKGAVLTHSNLVNNLLQSKQWMHLENGKDIYLSAYPLFHMAGLALGMAGMMLGNPQILIPDPRNTDHIVDEYEKYLPTYMANVPVLYRMLLDNPRFRKLNFTQLKTCRSGAAPFAVENVRALEEIVGEGKVVEVYGMSETSPIITMNPHRGAKKIGSVGLPIQSTYVKVVDLEKGAREVPIGEEGELIVRGPQVTKGYYKKPEETAHALRDLDGHKWLYTGDVAKMDEDGFITLVDRTKDMLNVSGYKVFSREVEETFYEHPAVELCAIVGIPDPKRPGSEIVKAVIQVRQSYKHKNPSELEDEIIAYCRENLAPYKAPKIVEIVEKIPLTPVGKIDKKALRS